MVQQLEKLPLSKRMQTIEVNMRRIHDTKFEKLEVTAREIGEDQLIKQMIDLNRLSHLIDKKFLPKLEQEDALFDNASQMTINLAAATIGAATSLI